MELKNEVCQGGKQGGVMYIGDKKQCLEAPVKTTIYATEDFEISRDDMNDPTKWKQGIIDGKLYVMPLIEGLEESSTEDKEKEGRYATYLLKKGVEGQKYRFDLSICGYAALKTVENSKFKRVFEITDKGEVTADKQENGKYKGRKLVTLTVSKRSRATDEDVPFVKVNHKFVNDLFSILKPDANLEDLEGVYHLNFTNETVVNATTLTFNAYTGCSETQVENLVKANIKIYKPDGSEYTVSALVFDSATGKYKATTSGLPTSGNFGEIHTDGIIDAGVLYKG